MRSMLWFLWLGVGFVSAAPTPPSKDDRPAGAIGRLGDVRIPDLKEAPQPWDINALTFLNDQVLFVGTNSGAQTWDITKRQPRQAKPVGGPVFAVSKDTARLLVASTNKVHLIEPPESATLEPRHRWDSTANAVKVLAYAPASGRIVFTDSDRELNFLTLSADKGIRKLAVESPLVAATFAANGRILALATRDGAVRVYALSATGELSLLWGKRMLRNDHIALTFNHDGRLLGVGVAGRAVIFDAITGQMVRSFDRKFGEGDIRAIAFAPSSLQIATANRDPDQVVRVWNVFDGQEVAAFKGHQGSVRALAFTANGKTLASGGTDGSVLLWNVPATGATTSVPVKDAWAALDSLDTNVAFRMFDALLHGGPESVELLRTSVLDAVTEQERLRRLITQLDHDEFRIREAARKALLQAGLRAMPLLKDPQRKLLGAEGEQRVASILESFELAGLRGSENGLYGEPLRHVRAVRILELLNTKPARTALEEIAKGKPDLLSTKEAKAALLTLPESK